MKTRFKYVTCMAAALVLGFSSCSNDDEAGSVDNGTPKSLYLKITNGPATYAEGDAVVDGTDVTFASGELFFVNASGTVLAKYTLSAVATGGSNIKIDDIKAGTTITDLPGAVSAVHIAGNVPVGVTLPAIGGNVSALQSQMLLVATQGTIANVTLYGGNSLPTIPTTAATPTTNAVYDVSVDIKPLVARIELTDITAGGVIESFQVDGIFVDNYYSQATIGGTFAPVDLISNGASAPIFIGDGSSPQYLAADGGISYDGYPSGLASASKVVVPASGQVWGYNLFAAAAGSAVPRIIIRLSNFDTGTSGVVIADPQFITITGLKDVSTSASLATIKAGEVYNIAAGAFVFDETNLTPTPNMSTIDVAVTVTLAQWTTVDVTPEF